MNRLTAFTALLASLLAFSSNSMAASESCTAKAAEKKLAGAAKNSFMGKCERDAQAACEASAAEKKLAGAAKNSFTTRCVKDAVGTP